MDIPPDVTRIKSDAESDLLKRPGVTGVGIGYKEVKGRRTDKLAIRVYVERKRKVPPDEVIPTSIDGVATDVIERTFRLAALPDTATYNPVVGGVSLGMCRSPQTAGTLGCQVVDNTSGQVMILSCFHVMCLDTSWAVGDSAAQPSVADTGSCPNSVVGSLVAGTCGGTVDCAIASQSARGTACEVVDIGPIAGTHTASLGLSVRKRGRTTGLTSGTVTDANLTVDIDYGGAIGVKRFTNQFLIDPDLARSNIFANRGDSGAVVVDNGAKIVGLLFAVGQGVDTAGIANPIADVLNALDVSIAPGTVG
jgi:hypothetical protein